MRLHRLLLTVLITALVAGCGSSGSSGGGSGSADPAQAIPSGTLVYVEGAVRPEGDQGDNVRALLQKFMPAGTTLESLLDKSIQKDDPGKSYAKDIKPWLGERAGIGVVDLTGDDSSFIAALDVTDADKAEAFISSSKGARARGSEYKGAQPYVDADDQTWAAVKDDYLFFAETEANLKRGIDAADGDSLADGKVFQDAIGDLPDERLGALFVDLKGVVGLAGQNLGPSEAAVLKQVLGNSTKPITAALTAESDSATIEARAPALSLGLIGAGESTDLVKDAPADSFAVFGAAGVGATIKTTVEKFAGALGGAALTGQLESQTGINLDRDVYSWIGDVAVFARGESVATLNGALVIGVTDQDAAKAAIPRLIAAAKRNGAPVAKADVKGADQAYSLPVPGAPGPVVIAQGGDRVVLAFGEDAAAEGLAPSTDTIADSGRYDAAKGAIDGIAPSLLVSLPAVLKLAESSGATDDADYTQAKPYLDKLDLVVTGSEKDGDSLRSLFTVTTK
ncbi:MAG: hypothetical protein QOI80_3445 [Solirubrobacteraceae bacterium]|nr:hypothetical protein [Solirubrobacteraceae bacterium]